MMLDTRQSGRFNDRLPMAIISTIIFLHATAISHAKDPLAWPRNPYLCYGGPDTFSYRIQHYDAVVLVRLAADGKRDVGKSPAREHRILEVAKDAGSTLSKGERVIVPGDRPAKPDDLFLLVGDVDDKDKNGQVVWWRMVRVTRACFEYIVAAPSPTEPTTKRLPYFLQHVESSDRQIDADAFAEFQHVGYQAIPALTRQLPADRIREWIADSEKPFERRGLYGLMLGLCGREEDAKLLRRLVGEPSEEFRKGLEGAMAGFLLLTGETGLDFLDESRLKDNNVSVFEALSAMQAIRFLRSSRPRAIDNARLQESMRLVLDRPDLADLAIYDLARMNDWSVQDRLMELYGADGYDIPAIKRSIVWYMFASTNDLPDCPGEETLQRVERVKSELAELRRRDPEIVEMVERISGFGDRR